MSLLRYESQVREPLVSGTKTYHNVTEDICRPIEIKPTKLWYVGLVISIILLLFGVYSIYRETVLWCGAMEYKPHNRLGVGILPILFGGLV